MCFHHYADVLKAIEFKFDKKHTFVHWCASPGLPIRTRQKPGHHAVQKNRSARVILLPEVHSIASSLGYTLSVVTSPAR